MRGFLDSCPLDIAERVIPFLPLSDVGSLRLVSKQWLQLTNRYVTKLRPRSLTELPLCLTYPGLRAVDLSRIDIVYDRQLQLAAKVLEGLDQLKEVALRCGGGVTREGFAQLAKRVPGLEKLTIYPCTKRCTLQEMPLDLETVPFELFTGVRQLDLSWNTMTIEAMEAIGKLPELESLNLKNCLGVDDDIVEVLLDLPRLRVLNLSSTGITDDALMSMNDLELEVLNLSDCKGITDDGMYWLQHIRSLRKLDISSCPNVTTAGVEQLTYLPNLSHLYVQKLKTLSSSIFRRMRSLETLSLRDCPWVTCDTLEQLAGCKQLRSVNLRNCDRLSDEALRFLIQLTELRCVNLRGCTGITDDGIEVLSRSKSIEDVDLSFLNQMTDAGLRHLAKVASLRRLIVNWCNRITAVGLKHVQSSCHRLRELSIKGCHNMRTTDLLALSSYDQKLDYEHSVCTVKEDRKTLPVLRHIDSVGCFLEIC